jgi:N-acetylglucosamine kinase-like BadF-type ATPase
MSEAGLALGVDGGGSKTVAVLTEAGGRVLGAGRAGNADIYGGPQAVEEVAQAIAAALAQAGARPERISAAALSLVGADWPEDFDYWRERLGRLGLGHLPPERALLVNDALGALAAGAPEGPAVAVVCGTGCAVGARGPDGRTWHSSFWQRTQGGGELAERALDAVYLAELGIAPATRLTPLALRHFGAADVADLLHAFTARERRPPRARSTFAPLVLDAAGEGDVVARDLALAHAEALAGYGLAAARQAGLSAGTPVQLVLAGGVFRHPGRLMPDLVIERLRAALPRLTIVEQPPEPVAGAVLLALDAIGAGAAEPLRARLVASLPPPAFFHTALAAEA